MNAEWIITTFVLIDTLMEQLDHRSHTLAQVPDAAIVTVAVVAAKYFQKPPERALCVLRATHYVPGQMDLACFNRRLQALVDGLAFIATTCGALVTGGAVLGLESLPGPI
jgi:hypothetical protein